MARQLEFDFMKKSYHDKMLEDGYEFVDVVPGDRVYCTDRGFLSLNWQYKRTIVAAVNAVHVPEIRLAHWIKDKQPMVLYARRDEARHAA